MAIGVIGPGSMGTGAALNRMRAGHGARDDAFVIRFWRHLAGIALPETDTWKSNT